MENKPLQISVFQNRIWQHAITVYLLGNSEDGTAARTRIEYDIDYALQDFGNSRSAAVSLESKMLHVVNEEQLRLKEFTMILKKGHF